MATESTIQLGTILGRVTDVAGTGGTTGRKKRIPGSPVSNAKMQLYHKTGGAPIETYTDDNGYYAFTNCSLGDYLVVCDAFEATPQEQDVKLKGTSAPADFYIPVGLQITSYVLADDGRRRQA